MTSRSFAVFPIFGYLASFMIGKYVRNYVIDNPCTKPCWKLPESMFVSSNCVFQRRRWWTFFSEGDILFSELFGKWFNFVKWNTFAALDVKTFTIRCKYEGYTIMEEIWEMRMGGYIKGVVGRRKDDNFQTGIWCNYFNCLSIIFSRFKWGIVNIKLKTLVVEHWFIRPLK